MAQSVELVLDEYADAELRADWERLAAAGLPSLRRDRPDENHRPHITLWAGPSILPAADDRLASELAGEPVDLILRVGPPMVFGPRRGSYILVRHVAAGMGLLDLQARVLSAVGTDPSGQFGPGGWTPHVTLARRLPVDRLGEAVAALGAERTLEARAARIRRWDGDRRTAWWLTPEQLRQ